MPSCATRSTPTSLFTRRELRAAGYAAHVLRKVGYVLFELVEGGYTATELRAAGYDQYALKESGFTAADLRLADFTSRQLQMARYGLREMQEGGFSWKDLGALIMLRSRGEALQHFRPPCCKTHIARPPPRMSMRCDSHAYARARALR